MSHGTDKHPHRHARTKTGASSQPAAASAGSGRGAVTRCRSAGTAPDTYAEAERAAKTLLAVGKVLDAVNTETRDDLPTKPARVTTADPAVEQAALTTWQAVLNHSLETLAEARRMNREAAP